MSARLRAHEEAVGGRSDSNRTDEHRALDDAPTHPGEPVEGVSRIDTMPAGMVERLSRRPPRVGDVLAGRYRLVEALGEGGMGEVFVADNLVIGRKVAVKLLKPDLLADESFRRRFQQEATAVAAIEHRNVAGFFDLVVGDPTFLVMEHVAGSTLSKVLRREQRLDPVRAINIGIRLSWALHAAHAVGIIHRDIKPANVILAPDPEHGEEPKLIDFGLAKVPTIVGAETLTRTGQIVGTPAYMSPEQIANRDVDARSDVYALGCLIYHMIAGRPPFAGGDDVQILYQQIERVPDPLSMHASHAPAELAAVVARALEKKRENRFQSMRELAEALRTVERRRATSELATAAESTAFVRLPRRIGRRWLALAAAGVVAALAGGFFAGSRTRAATASGGAVVVTSRPNDAVVEIDGTRILETTPTMVRGLAAGAHRVRVSAAGRAPIEQNITVEPAARVVVDVSLPASSRAVEVQSVPDGAAVFVDGVRIPGETPVTVTLTDDDFHELRVEKLGYEPEEHAVKPEDREAVVTLPLRPERQPRGMLAVDAAPGDQLWIDGKNSGYLTPTLPIWVAAGEHVIELRDSTGRTRSVPHIEVRQGETVHLNIGAKEDACAEKAK